MKADHLPAREQNGSGFSLQILEQNKDGPSSNQIGVKSQQINFWPRKLGVLSTL